MPPFHPQMKRNPTPRGIDGGIWVSRCNAQPVTQVRQVRAYIFESKIDGDGMVKNLIKVTDAGLDRKSQSDSVLAQLPPCPR